MKLVEEDELEKLYNSHQKKIEKSYREKQKKMEENKKTSSRNNQSGQKTQSIHNHHYANIQQMEETKYKRRSSKQGSISNKNKVENNHSNYEANTNIVIKGNKITFKNLGEQNANANHSHYVSTRNGNNNMYWPNNKKNSSRPGSKEKEIYSKSYIQSNNTNTYYNNPYYPYNTNNGTKPINKEVIDIKSYISESVRENVNLNNQGNPSNPNNPYKKKTNFSNSSYFSNSLSGFKQTPPQSPIFSSPKSDKKLLHEVDDAPDQKENLIFKNKIDLLINKHDMTKPEMEKKMKVKCNYIMKPYVRTTIGHMRGFIRKKIKSKEGKSRNNTNFQTKLNKSNGGI